MVWGKSKQGGRSKATMHHHGRVSNCVSVADRCPMLVQPHCLVVCRTCFPSLPSFCSYLRAEQLGRSYAGHVVPGEETEGPGNPQQLHPPSVSQLQGLITVTASLQHSSFKDRGLAEMRDEPCICTTKGGLYIQRSIPRPTRNCVYYVDYMLLERDR